MVTGFLLFYFSWLVLPQAADLPPFKSRQIGALGRAAAYHQQLVIADSGDCPLKGVLLPLPPDALHQGYPVIPGIAAAAVFHSDPHGRSPCRIARA